MILKRKNTIIVVAGLIFVSIFFGAFAKATTCSKYICSPPCACDPTCAADTMPTCGSFTCFWPNACYGTRDACYYNYQAKCTNSLKPDCAQDQGWLCIPQSKDCISPYCDAHNNCCGTWDSGSNCHWGGTLKCTSSGFNCVGDQSCKKEPHECYKSGSIYKEQAATFCTDSGCARPSPSDCTTGYACDGIASREDGDSCTLPGHCSNDNQCAEGYTCQGGDCVSSCTADGTSCTQDSDCCSGNCVLDYDGTGKVCAPANQCWHNNNYYNVNQDYGADTDNFICRSCSSGHTARWIYNSNGRFIVRTSSTPRLILDKAGNLLIEGSLLSGGIPNGYDWQVKDSAGAVKAWLDDATGNFYLDGALSQEQSSISPSGNGDFLIKYDTGGYYVGMIDGGTGNMKIRGQLGQQCDLP